MDKDVTSAAVAETWAGGPSGAGSFVFMYMGTGIGCGIVLNDEVVRGTSGTPAKSGISWWTRTAPPCDCGLQGCVKSSCHPAGPGGRGRSCRHPGVVPRTDTSGAEVQQSFARLCDLADAGNGRPLAIIDKSAVLVARAVSVVTNTLDVESVVFGGPFWSRLSERYLESPGAAGANSAARLIHTIEVVGTGVGEDVGAIGAACLVLEHTLAPRAQRLLLEG